MPPWLRVKIRKSTLSQETSTRLARHGVNTVCAHAKCPNIGECYHCGTATFLLLGTRCTRGCRFCAVEDGPPDALDPEEPERVAAAAQELGLRHVVITSVTRDDLPDGGAAHFAAAVRAVKRALPEATVEVLVPDFLGDEDAVRTVIEAGIDVFNHNIETVPRLYPVVRPGADYRRSLRVLESAGTVDRNLPLKSGVMLGLGEEPSEVLTVMDDLLTVGCRYLTLGQYLSPSPRHLPVARFVTPEEFEEYGHLAREKGFAFAASAPFVRSSYRAYEALQRSR